MPVVEVNEPELVAWGERFGRELAFPSFVTLGGELGAGKTTLVRAIARAQGFLEPVTSMSYGVVREYLSPRGPVVHIDLYRLDGPDQLPQVGWEDYLHLKGLVMVEWPERAKGALPARARARQARAAAHHMVSGLSLALDAAAGPGTIAVLRDGAVVVERTVEMRSAAEERFFPAVLEALMAANASTGGLARVIAGAGPGSFTALRVVGAIAKGICEGAGCPLFGVPSLALIAAGAPTTTGGGRFLTTLDALRGERYAALVVVAKGGAVVAIEPLGLVAIDALDARASALGATRIGPDETRAERPHARGVARCRDLVMAGGPVDLASWEPVYGRLAEAQVKWEAAHGRALVAERHAT